MQLDDEHIRRIAEHAYKHALEGSQGRFNGEKYGAPMNINSVADLERSIKESLASDRLQHFERADGGRFIRDPDNNLTIAFRSDQDGTCYRASEKERDFERVMDKERDLRSERGLAPARLEERALIERVQRQEVEKKAQRAPKASLNDLFDRKASDEQKRQIERAREERQRQERERQRRLEEGRTKDQH